MTFEHKALIDNLSHIIMWVEDQGTKGWELVSVVPTSYHINQPIMFTAFMKRAPKLETEYD